MPTYYYVATFEADSPEEAAAIVRHPLLDEPAELPTVGEIRGRIHSVLNNLLVDAGLTAGTVVPELPAAVARILEIVTLGNVPAS